MKSFVRSLVMWLLVFALPVQGFAATTMLLCGAGHHGAAPATAGGHDHSSHVHAEGHGSSGTPESHADGHPAEAKPANEGSSASPLSAPHAKAVVGKCSACAACCTVAFLPVSIIAFTAPAPSRIYALVEMTTHVGHVADGLDRPPRFLLA